jgi:hypothetical protein
MSVTAPVSTRFRFAINTSGCNKDWDYKILSADYKDRSGTLDDLITHVQNGHALCAGLLGNRWRKKENFLGSQLVLIDLDNSAVMTDKDGNPVDEDGRPLRIGRQWVDVNRQPIDKSDGRKAAKVYKHQLTIDEAKQNPFIQRHCALIYTTPSHSREWHRFRMVFVLPEVMDDIDAYEALVLRLLQFIPHDPACKDGVRIFYGNTEAEFPLINPNTFLPSQWIPMAQQDAIAAKEERERRLKEAEQRRREFNNTARRENWNTDDLIREALMKIPRRELGSGNYVECRNVLMALVDYYGEYEAEELAEWWSPSIPGTTWNIKRKIRTFKRSGVTIGTLFRIAKQYRFQFPRLRFVQNGEQNRFNTIVDKVEEPLKTFTLDSEVRPSDEPLLEPEEPVLDVPLEQTDEYKHVESIGINIESCRKEIQLAIERYEDPEDFKFALYEIAKAFGKPFDFINRMAEGLILDETVSLGGELIGDIAPRVYVHAEQVKDGSQEAGIPCGLGAVDEQMGGFSRKDLVIWGARPSLGKTALVLGKVAYETIKKAKDGKVILFSLEMSKEQIATRLLSSLSGVNVTRLRKGDMCDSDFGYLMSACDQLRDLGMVVEDNIDYRNPTQFIKKVLDKHSDEPIHGVFIDYLQLMGANDDRNKELDGITRTLKRYANAYDCPFHVLSQLSREVEKRSDKRPIMADLRDSGGIEANADVVAFLYRDDYYNRESENRGIVELDFRKNRNGPVFMTKLGVNFSTMSFWDLDSNDENN